MINQFFYFYFTDQKFISCTESGHTDKCVDCQPGTIMLDKMDTYNWETPQECLPSGCNECDLSGTGTFNR